MPSSFSDRQWAVHDFQGRGALRAANDTSRRVAVLLLIEGIEGKAVDMLEQAVDMLEDAVDMLEKALGDPSCRSFFFFDTYSPGLKCCFNDLASSRALENSTHFSLFP